MCVTCAFLRAGAGEGGELPLFGWVLWEEIALILLFKAKVSLQITQWLFWQKELLKVLVVTDCSPVTSNSVQGDLVI